MKILEHMVKYLIEERAFDVLKNEGINRVIRSYKLHHPSLRGTCHRFVEKVLDLTF